MPPELKRDAKNRKYQHLAKTDKGKMAILSKKLKTKKFEGDTPRTVVRPYFPPSPHRWPLLFRFSAAIVTICVILSPFSCFLIQGTIMATHWHISSYAFTRLCCVPVGFLGLHYNFQCVQYFASIVRCVHQLI